MEQAKKIDELERRLEDHILEDAKVHTLQDEKMDRQRENVDKLVVSTQGLVDAWIIANGIHKFIKLISGFGLLVAACIWLAKKLI